MRIIIEIRHPAHVHHFKNFIKLMREKHKIKILATKKECSIELLKKYDINYEYIGSNKHGLFKKFVFMLFNDIKVYKITKKFDADIIVGRSSPSLAHIGWLRRIPFLSFTDTEHAKINYILSFPFAKNVLIPSCFKKRLGPKFIRINSFFELAYLHPVYFTPDPNVLNILGIKKNEKFIIMRFVLWSASHDIGYSGLTLENKRKAVKELSKYAKVFISSEGELTDDLKLYQITIPTEKMHDVLSYATLYIGEGATMASECAMLGTPSIYVNSLTAGTLEEQGRYGLIFSYRNFSGVINKAKELLQISNLKQQWQKRRQNMLKDKIDVTAFMVWFIENYPESVRIMKVNPVETQKQFL